MLIETLLFFPRSRWKLQFFFSSSMVRRREKLREVEASTKRVTQTKWYVIYCYSTSFYGDDVDVFFSATSPIPSPPTKPKYTWKIFDRPSDWRKVWRQSIIREMIWKILLEMLYIFVWKTSKILVHGAKVHWELKRGSVLLEDISVDGKEKETKIYIIYDFSHRI